MAYQGDSHSECFLKFVYCKDSLHYGCVLCDCYSLVLYYNAMFHNHYAFVGDGAFLEADTPLFMSHYFPHKHCYTDNARKAYVCWDMDFYSV